MTFIPMTFHFTFYRGTKSWRWNDIHTLCLKSCQRYSGATRIVVHYDRTDDGSEWDTARAIGGIEWRQVTFPTTINGHPVGDQRISCDVYRLQTLWEEGGFYCDLDFVFLKSFEKFRDNHAIIGTQCRQKQKLACGLMGCVPGSSFIRAYLDSYSEWVPADEIEVCKFANRVPWELSQRHPVAVVPRSTFYPIAWTNRNFWSGGRAPLKNAHAFHLWQNLKPNVRVDDLRRTALEPYVESVLNEHPTGVVHMLRETILLKFE